MASIRMLKTFWAVAKHGSFAAAARDASQTQAAVSLQMRSLEQALQRPLFERSARQVTLSRQGRDILPKVEQILALVSELYTDPIDPMQGPVTISAVVSVIGALSIAVAALKTRHPLLDVRLLSARSDELATMVERGDVDIAAIVAHPDDPLPHPLTWTTLYTEPMVLVARRATPGVGGVDRAPVIEANTVIGDDVTALQATLARCAFLRFDRRVRTGMLVDQALRLAGLTVHEYLELNSIDTIVTLIRKGIGVAVLPALHGAGWQHDPELELLPLPDTVPPRTVGVIQRSAFARRGITAALIDLLNEG